MFDARGSEIYLRPASEYVVLQQPVTFYTVVESARRRGEVAIGYRLVDRAASTALGHGVVINPRKPERITFGDRDLVIVLAED